MCFTVKSQDISHGVRVAKVVIFAKNHESERHNDMI